MKKHLYQLLAILVIAVVATACGAGTPAATDAPATEPDAPTDVAMEGTNPASTEGGTIAVSGAFALYPMMVTWADEYQKLYPNVKIDVSAGGAGKGMADALAGAVDIGMVSRAITDEETAQGAYAIGSTKDAVFATVNAANPVLAELQAIGLTPELANKIYITQEIKTWGEVVGKPEITDEIHLYTRSDAAGAADIWAKYALGKAQDDLKGIGVNADPGLLEAVVKDPLGIGFNNLNYAYDLSTGNVVEGAAVIPLDANGNGKADPDEIFATTQEAADAVANGRYPSPPARVEWLVTKDKPTGITQEFILWILTDGQQYLSSAGYVALPADQLDVEIAKVK